MDVDQQFDVIIIGGGATGAGILRDLTRRGLKTVLFEKNDLAQGTTGRCHGLLHSGARYVTTDPIAAQECAVENTILRKIAPHIIDPCDGYFVALTEDDLTYKTEFLENCAAAKVSAEEIPLEEFQKIEPNCSDQIKCAIKVKDAYIDPFLLTYYNALDAKLHGATILSYCEVKHLILTEKEIVGVRYHNHLTKVTENLYAKIIINATGPWAAILEQDLKLEKKLRIAPTQGTLLIMKNRLVNSVINRLHRPSNGDIIVPSHQTIILGTSSIPTQEQSLDQLEPSYEEIDELLHLGEKLVPAVKSSRMIRYYTGARPLVVDRSNPEESSRKFEVIDYHQLGYEGFITIFGGKLTTYRLMAEKVSDLVCKKLSVEATCTTHEIPLPGGENALTKEEIQKKFQLEDRQAFDLSLKWGSFIQEMGDLCLECLDTSTKEDGARIICSCEKVSQNELKWARENLFIHTLDDYRRRTRQGMGPCQGQFCFFKLADLEIQWSGKSHPQIMEELKKALEKRWKTEELVDDMQKRQIKLSKYMYILGGNL